MAARPSQPEPFVRGAPYPAANGVPYPRANPADVARLPADVWHSGSVPAGVRLELVGDAQAIDIAYRTVTGSLGYRGDGAGIVFSVWRSGRKVCEEEAVLGDGLIRLSLGSGSPDKPAVIYLPEGMQPLVLSLTAVKGEIAPAPALPRWLAYGDAVTQGWIASGPAQGWAAITARKSGLDLINLGFAGSGQAEIVSAEHLASLQADVISIAYGANCWTRTPHSAPMLFESVRGFLALVRSGHPTTPMVVISPIRRTDAEHTPNKLGATLVDLRDAVEAATRDRIVSGDTMLSLVAGEDIISPEHLADGIHPGDEGHKRIASATAKALSAAMQTAREASTMPVLVDSSVGLGLTLAVVGRNGHADESDEPLVSLDESAPADGTLVSLDESVAAIASAFESHSSSAGVVEHGPSADESGAPIASTFESHESVASFDEGVASFDGSVVSVDEIHAPTESLYESDEPVVSLGESDEPMTSVFESDGTVVSVDETVATMASVFESDEPVLSLDEPVLSLDEIDEPMASADQTAEPVAPVWSDLDPIDPDPTDHQNPIDQIDSIGTSEVAETVDDPSPERPDGRDEDSARTRTIADDDITSVLAPDVAAAWALY